METDLERTGNFPWREKRVWVPLGLILFWGIWNLCLFRFFDPESEGIAMMLVFGPFYGQPVLAALWGGWGPGRALVRWPASFGLVVLQALCITGGEDLLDMLLGFIVAFLGCFVLLLVGRRITGWRIHHGEVSGVSSANGRYGVRYLIGLTTFVALLSGLAKATDAIEWAQSGGLDPDFLVITTLILVLFSMPVALLSIVILMTGRHLLLRVSAVFLIGVAATLAIAIAMKYEFGESIVEGFLPIGALMVGASLSVGISAAALRWAGFRVGRKPGNPKVAAGGNLDNT